MGRLSERLDDWLERYTRFAHARPWRVLLLAFVVIAGSWSLASTLRIRGNFVQLLPSESPTAQRFLSSLERRGGGSSTLLVLVESPDADANRRFVDALEARLEGFEESLLSSVEHGPEAERKYFNDWRWLFASRRDLLLIECEIRREREKRSPFDLGLDESSCDEQVDEELGSQKTVKLAEPSLDETEVEGAKAFVADPDDSPIESLKKRVEYERKKRDRFPTGYFRNESGSTYALVLRSPTSGMGAFSADELYQRVQQEVLTLDPSKFHEKAVVGYAGDIPNAIAEREALIEDITIVSSVAVGLILLVILLYFRSFVVLLHILVAVSTGCGVAFAAAALAYGHLNAATSFLGSIILGNGINDSIIYLARYRERRAQGDSVEQALVDASKSCRRGTWLASVAASGAYAALMVTSFRGFSEFGLIGGVGMVTCWFATFGFCPASVTVLERLRRTPKPAGDVPRTSMIRPKFSPFIARAIARIALASPRTVLLSALVLVVIAGYPLKSYVQDPWEYNFSKLRSKKSKRGGAGHWSKRADEIFKTRGSPELLLADDMEQASAVADRVVQRDQKLFEGRWVERVVTVHDRLGGRPELLKEKLEILERIREEMDQVLPRLKGDEAAFAREWRPPDDLRVPRVEDLPPLIKARFTEADGREGTAVYVYLNRKLSRSKGQNLLEIADLLEGVSVKQGHIVPNASRATVFAEMIRSMSRDAPRATLAALLCVVLVSLLATRALGPASAVLGSLLVGVWLTVGCAAWLNVRLNFLNFVALPLTFGIGVEYAINLYDRVRLYGGDIARGIASAGGAVGLCSLTTILGYGSLIFADNQALQSFGKYAVFGEVSCMLTALVIMPATLEAFRRRQRNSSASTT